jgi:prevent-host-death family protein
MTDYSVAEAKAKLSELIERAQKGEGVVITKHGHPVAELKPARLSSHAPRPMAKADAERLAKRLVGRKGSRVHAGQFVSRMRDEGEK